MKETGVIRRIDELGRIVIPKEIRKKLKIRTGDSLDIFVSNDTIVLEKYSALKDLDAILDSLLDALKSIYSIKIIVTDMTQIIASNINELAKNESLNNNLIKTIEYQEEIELNAFINNKITENFEITSYAKVKPIIIYGDLFGSIIVIEASNKTDEVINILNSFIMSYLIDENN